MAKGGIILGKRILVTGATGYVGSALAPAIAQHWPVVSYDLQAFGNAIDGAPGVTSIQGDIRDTDRLRKLLADQAITDVIWLAGIVTDGLVDMNVQKARAINVDALRDGLVACRSTGVRRFILMSSSSVYGSSPEPATEETPPNPQTAYAQSKLDQEKELWAGKGFMVGCAIRSATLMGPAPRMRLDTITGAFSKQAWFDGRITVWDGRQSRSNVHVQDVVECYRRLLEAEPAAIDGLVLNLVHSHKTALEIASTVATEVAFQKGASPLVVVDTAKIDDRHYRMISTRMPSVLHWTPERSIDKAVADNCAWFKAGHIADPNDDIYDNNRRMSASMKG